MREYARIEDIFTDGIFTPYDTLVVWAKRGKGKSAFSAFLQTEFMRPAIARIFLAKSKEKCENLKRAGIYIEPPTDHLVFNDTFCEDYRNPGRIAYNIQATDIGIPNKIHKVKQLIPFSQIFLEEMQDLFDSHIGSLPTFVTKAFELARHNGLFICMTLQRPMRLHKDIREIATFIEIVEMRSIKNRYGKLLRTEWICNIIYDNANLEAYLNSKDKDYVDLTVKFVFKGNIFNCYDPEFFSLSFYSGENYTELPLNKSQRLDFTPEYLKFFKENHCIDIPESYRGKVPKASKSNKKESDNND